MSKFEAGLAEWFDPSKSNPVIQIPTFQCAHCGAHRAITPGKKQNGFCMRCNGYVCGRTCSGTCKPHERMLEEMEGTKNPTAVTVAVPNSLVIPGKPEHRMK